MGAKNTNPKPTQASWLRLERMGGHVGMLLRIALGRIEVFERGCHAIRF